VGFLPDLKSVIGLAGTQSALALYNVRELEFLYVTRMAQAQFAQSALAAVRGKFEQRQAGSVPFYLRTDPSSNRTVVFAAANGYLFLATRDDLVARALTLLAGSSEPNVASEPWYQDAAAAQPKKGELRMVTNLDALVKSVYFRSYWIQRNASALRQFRAGIADVTRLRNEITESRVLLREPLTAGQASGVAAGRNVARLVALVPAEAGFYKAFGNASPSEVADVIVDKLMAASPKPVATLRFAPIAAPLDERAGTEADLETRIDEPALPADAGLADARAILSAVLKNAGIESILVVQVGELSSEAFVRTPAVIALAASGAWNPDEIRSSLSGAVGALWTVSGIGSGWTTATIGNHSFERLDGLGGIEFAVRGPLLFVGTDERLLSGMLDRVGTAPSETNMTYAAGFRHSRERAHYEAMMRALDFTSPDAGQRFGIVVQNGSPPFFSGNLASLSGVLTRISEVSFVEQAGDNLVQRVVYRIAP
jgi:hypothetical protein